MLQDLWVWRELQVGEFLGADHGADEWVGTIAAAERAECQHIVFAKYGWDDDRQLFSRDELSVHHDARDAAVSVDEWMDIADEKRGEMSLVSDFTSEMAYASEITAESWDEDPAYERLRAA